MAGGGNMGGLAQPVEFWMYEALKVATLGLEKGELPIGAVVVSSGRSIAAAHTEEKAQKRLLVHAELLALEAADRLNPFPGKRSDSVLFTTLEPCLMCMGAALSFGVGAIYYALESASDGAVALIHQWQRDENAMPYYRIPQIEGGLLRQESIALFRRYVEQHISGAMWEWAKTIAAQ